MDGFGDIQDTNDFINKKCKYRHNTVNLKKKENILQNGERQ